MIVYPNLGHRVPGLWLHEEKLYLNFYKELKEKRKESINQGGQEMDRGLFKTTTVKTCVLITFFLAVTKYRAEKQLKEGAFIGAHSSQRDTIHHGMEGMDAAATLCISSQDTEDINPPTRLHLLISVN